jgi:hypothetical protein
MFRAIYTSTELTKATARGLRLQCKGMDIDEAF